ncbi:unnamed protein product [Diplocarpon coronariae]
MPCELAIQGQFKAPDPCTNPDIKNEQNRFTLLLAPLKLSQAIVGHAAAPTWQGRLIIKKASS